MAQMPLGGGDPSRMTLDQVYEAAAKAAPIFERVMRGIAIGAGLDPADSEQVMFAPLKGRARCEEKTKEEYNGDASRLVDMVRCSVIVTTELELIAVAKALAQRRRRRRSATA